MFLVTVNAPGMEPFTGRVIPGLGDLPARDDRGPLAIVADQEGDLYVVPACCVKAVR